MALAMIMDVILAGLVANFAIVTANSQAFADAGISMAMDRGEVASSNAHTTSESLSRAVMDSLRVSSRNTDSGDDDVGLFPSTIEELKLSSAIAAQSKIVSDASKALFVLQTRLNDTLQEQETAQYQYEVASRVSKQIVDRYLERESVANDSQIVLRDLSSDPGVLGSQLINDTAAAKNASKSVAAEKEKLFRVESAYKAINSTLEKAEQDFIAADNKSKVIAGALKMRTDALQEAIDKLNELNDELVEAQEAAAQARESAQSSMPSLTQVAVSRPHRRRSPTPSKMPLLDEANLTEAVHDQAKVVAKLTNDVTALNGLLSQSMRERGQAEDKYLAAQSLANGAAAASNGSSLDALQAQSLNASKAVVVDMAKLSYSANAVSQEVDRYSGLVQELIMLRNAVQTATDTELQAKINSANANVTLETFQEVLRNQTSLLQEEVDKLNLLNDQLMKLQDTLSRGS